MSDGYKAIAISIVAATAAAAVVAVPAVSTISTISTASTSCARLIFTRFQWYYGVLGLLCGLTRAESWLRKG